MNTHVSTINNTLKHAQYVIHLRLGDLSRNLYTLPLVAYSVASFAHNEDGSSQIAFIFLLVDDTRNSGGFAFASRKSECVIHSMLRPEKFAFTDAVVEALLIRHDLPC